MEDRIEIEGVELEKLRCVVLHYLEERLLGFGESPEVEISKLAAWSTDEIVLRIMQEIWGREAGCKEAQWPADWWQAVKERWFPAWAKTRWPVEYKHVKLTARELYPQIKRPPHQYQGVIAISKSEW